MTVTNLVLLPSTEGNASVTGSPIRASGSFRNSGGYVVTLLATNMDEGRLYIEATMEGQPTGWFAIPIDDEDYIEFPSQVAAVADVQTFTIPFDGNFTWVRARLDRTYTTIPETFGYVSAMIAIDGYQGTIPSSTPSGASTIVTAIAATNLGSGSNVLAAKTGTANVAMTFRSLLAGNGVVLTQNSTTIQIDSLTSSTFTGLNDTANAVVSNGVVIGQANGVVGFTPAASNGTVLSFVSGAYTFTPMADITGTNSIAVSRNGNAVVTAPTLNFTGNGVTVSNVAGVATINVQSEVDSLEYVVFQYSPGGAGNFNTVDRLVSKTSGVTVDVVDLVNCIVSFTFSDRPFPPTAIAIMGQVYQTNEFSYSSVNPGIGTRKIVGGGSSASPTLMGSFSGPITIQLRMADTGATAPAGQRAQAIAMFRF